MKLPAWITLQVATLAGAGLLAFLLTAQCNRAGRAEAAASAAAARLQEAAAAAAAGVPAVEQVDAGHLQMLLQAALRENDVLRRALDRAQDAIPGATVVGVVRVAVEGTAQGKPRPAPQEQKPSHEAPPTPLGGAAGAPDAGPSFPASGVACLLAQGDGLRLELEAPMLKGPAGGRYLVGSMAARRKVDGELLLREAFERALTEAAELAPAAPRPPGWAWGGGGGISGGGWLGAVLVQTPPRRLPLLGWPARAWVLGAGGATQGLVLGGVSVEP